MGTRRAHHSLNSEWAGGAHFLGGPMPSSGICRRCGSETCPRRKGSPIRAISALSRPCGWSTKPRWRARLPRTANFMTLMQNGFRHLRWPDALPVAAFAENVDQGPALSPSPTLSTYPRSLRTRFWGRLFLQPGALPRSRVRRERGSGVRRFLQPDALPVAALTKSADQGSTARSLVDLSPPGPRR